MCIRDSYFGVVKNAEAYFNYTSYLITSENGAKTTDAEGNAIEPVDPITFEAVSYTHLTNAVIWAANSGVTSGTSATTFSPDAVCTRAQIDVYKRQARTIPLFPVRHHSHRL